MSKITDLLIARRNQVEADMAQVTRQYRAEIDEIDKALAAIRGETPTSVKRIRLRLLETIPDQTMAILMEYPTGLKMRDVLEMVNTRFDRKIAPKNMSWHLAHLKSTRGGKKVIREGNLWKPSAQEVKTKQAAE